MVDLKHLDANNFFKKLEIIRQGVHRFIKERNVKCGLEKSVKAALKKKKAS